MGKINYEGITLFYKLSVTHKSVEDGNVIFNCYLT
jgi:hypothetical protein